MKYIDFYNETLTNCKIIFYLLVFYISLHFIVKLVIIFRLLYVIVTSPAMYLVTIDRSPRGIPCVERGM